MRLTWNGTGSAWAYYYGNSSAVIEADGQRLLIDCGHTVPGRLHQMELSLRDIDAVFISHLHGDHMYGLEEWGFRNLLQWQIKPRLLIAHDLASPLWHNVLSGSMDTTCNQQCKLSDYFNVDALHIGKPFTFGPWTLEIHPVRHVPRVPAYGVKIKAGSAAVGFTCDSMADADPWFYADTACVFHDCSFAPYFAGTIHSHYEQLRNYPQEFREKTFLVHYEDAIRQRREEPAWLDDLAATGMRLTAPFSSITLPLP